MEIRDWHRKAAIDAMKYGVTPFIEHILTPSECGAKITEAIASHDPGVDVGRLWCEITKRCEPCKVFDRDGNQLWYEVTKEDLAAAIESAKEGRT